jgi:ribosome-binding factor A
MLGSTIQKELAQIIMRELNDPRLTGMPSITRVKVSPDLSVADVYMTIMGTEGQQNAALNALRHSAGMMRTKLTKLLSLRQSPYLKFHIDENLKKELAVLETLRVVAEENAELDRKRAERTAAAEAAAAAQDPQATTTTTTTTDNGQPTTTDTP